MSNTKYSNKRHLEFGGAIGASLLVFGLPAAMMAINISCNKVFLSIYAVILFVSVSFLITVLFTKH